MQTSPHSQPLAAHDVAQDVAALFVRLGLEAVVRDPDSVEVIAATPGAESLVLAAKPGSVRVVTARVAGRALRVELLPQSTQPDDLTDRQREVAECLKKGMRNQQIAEHLGISLHTVRRHLEQMFRRLGVHNRKAAVDVLKRSARRGG